MLAENPYLSLFFSLKLKINFKFFFSIFLVEKKKTYLKVGLDYHIY